MSPPLFPDRDHIARRHPEFVTSPFSGQAVPILIVFALAGFALFALYRLEFSLGRFGSGILQLGAFLKLMIPPSPGGQGLAFLEALFETIAIAFLGTILAAVLAFPLGFLAARGMIGGRWLRFLTRRFSDSIRGVDTLIWALIWINVVGLGPFAGVLAIMTSDFGVFIKLFSEAIEAASPRPAEGVEASGGTGLHVLRFGILPEVLPVFISQVLYCIESNTRSATIIGIVGAGGIGLHLTEMIRTYEWQRVAFIILMVLASVAAIDFISTRLRAVLTGTRATPV